MKNNKKESRERKNNNKTIKKIEKNNKMLIQKERLIFFEIDKHYFCLLDRQNLSSASMIGKLYYPRTKDRI